MVGAVLGLAGWGRIGFDATGAADARPLARCVGESFDHSVANGWTVVDNMWTVLPGMGPDGSPAFAAGGGSSAHAMVPSALSGITEALVDIDFNVADATVGDFLVAFMEDGWTSWVSPRDQVGIFPPQSDSDPDQIARATLSPDALLCSHASTATAGAWHHLEVAFAADHAITVELDHVPYMSSIADATFTGPFDIMFGFWGGGLIDNVVVDCAR
jgi:hypothetical protein